MIIVSTALPQSFLFPSPLSSAPQQRLSFQDSIQQSDLPPHLSRLDPIGWDPADSHLLGFGSKFAELCFDLRCVGLLDDISTIEAALREHVC
jgi:hypothetical protein